jgi:coenzyme F420 hydrogenase subunit beta
MAQIKSLKDVVDWNLCTGCGACAYACTEGEISLVNIESVGIRPVFSSSACASCSKCLSICPGYQVDAAPVVPRPAKEVDYEIGSTLEIWEGHASDSEIRYRASSGGLLTALALYCLEQEEMKFVLHTGVSEETPWENKTVKSRTREELVSRAGSRYAPASPCDRLSEIEQSDKPCVFIGKPCDVTAVSALRRERPALDRSLGLVLTFFCAGTPSTKGTLDLAESFKILPEQIDSVRYRGEGWPGRFKVGYDNGKQEASASYGDSWGKLTHYRPLRCNLCPDGLGRLADIACGDAWENSSDNGNPGLSLVLVRTERGREILRGAIAANYVQLQRVDRTNVLAAQVNLLNRRREIFGRLVALRLFGIPVPRFSGFALGRSWLGIPMNRKIKTVLGTAKRVIARRLYSKSDISERAAHQAGRQAKEDNMYSSPRA